MRLLEVHHSVHEPLLGGPLAAISLFTAATAALQCERKRDRYPLSPVPHAEGEEGGYREEKSKCGLRKCGPLLGIALVVGGPKQAICIRAIR